MSIYGNDTVVYGHIIIFALSLCDRFFIGYPLPAPLYRIAYIKGKIFSDTFITQLGSMELIYIFKQHIPSHRCTSETAVSYFSCIIINGYSEGKENSLRKALTCLDNGFLAVFAVIGDLYHYMTLI